MEIYLNFIFVLISFSAYVVRAFHHNDSCIAPSLQIILHTNTYLQATRTVCDDHVELSIRQIIENGNRSDQLLIPEKDNNTPVVVAKLETNINDGITPSSVDKQLHNLSAPGKLLLFYCDTILNEMVCPQLGPISITMAEGLTRLRK
jgi:hypothetical protein